LKYEIEDAGGGCCLGPEVVVVRADDGRSCVQAIQPRQGRRRREVALRLVLRAFDRLGVVREDSLLVCRGDLFDLTVADLAEKGFQVERGPVSEDAHRLAEGEHLRRLRAILGYQPRMRDRHYAALNMLLRSEAERRPALRRHWKANVRPPAEWAPAAPAPPAGRRRDAAART
jgi:hypothetical protein